MLKVSALRIESAGLLHQILNDLRKKVRHHIAATVTDPFTISTSAVC